MASPTVGIIDAGQGNQQSVLSAFRFLGIEAESVNDPEKLARFSHALLPGVGSFSAGARKLLDSNFTEAIADFRESGRSILGICLGFQLFGLGSEESQLDAGLGFVSERAVHLNSITASPSFRDRVPHMGYDSVVMGTSSKLFSGIPEGSDFYFTHSYAFPEFTNDSMRTGLTRFSNSQFTAAIETEGLYGVQFHPERSQGNGLVILNNFARKC